MAQIRKIFPKRCSELLLSADEYSDQKYFNLDLKRRSFKMSSVLHYDLILSFTLVSFENFYMFSTKIGCRRNMSPLESSSSINMHSKSFLRSSITIICRLSLNHANFQLPFEVFFASGSEEVYDDSLLQQLYKC